MVERICNLPQKHSFFLFGARGTGKTTLLSDTFSDTYSLVPAVPKNVLLVDLLDPDQEEAYSRNPFLSNG